MTLPTLFFNVFYIPQPSVISTESGNIMTQMTVTLASMPLTDRSLHMTVTGLYASYRRQIHTHNCHCPVLLIQIDACTWRLNGLHASYSQIHTYNCYRFVCLIQMTDPFTWLLPYAVTGLYGSYRKPIHTRDCDQLVCLMQTDRFVNWL